MNVKELMARQFVRQMLVWARLNGWEHVCYVGPFGTEHTWTSTDYRVGLEFIDGIGARSTLSRKRRQLSVSWEVEVAKFEVTSVWQLVGVLRALDVIPGIEVPA